MMYAPILHPIPIRPKHNPRMLNKILHNPLAQPPSIAILQVQRQIPMIQRNSRLQSKLQARINNIRIMRQTFRIHLPSAPRHDTTPANTERVRIRPQSRHARNVLLVQEVVVVHHVRGTVVDNIARDAGEFIPNRRATAFGFHGAFDLVARAGEAPEEVFGEGPGFVFGFFEVRVVGLKGRVVERGRGQEGGRRDRSWGDGGCGVGGGDGADA